MPYLGVVLVEATFKQFQCALGFVEKNDQYFSKPEWHHHELELIEEHNLVDAAYWWV